MRDSWNAWGDDPQPIAAPRDGTLSLMWMKLRRLGPTRPTAIDDHEGQIRYERDGDVSGRLYLARYKAGGTYEWKDISYPPANLGYQNPPGPVVVDAASVTALASQQCGARYLGYTDTDVTSVEINVLVTTAVATSITYAEVGLASAPSATSGSLTRITTTDVSATWNSTGVKVVTFSATIPAGTYVYMIFGSQATTPFQLRATIADELSLGVTRLASTTRPSTMAAATSFTTSTAVTGAAWTGFRWS